MEPLQHETYIRDPTPLGFRIASVSEREKKNEKDPGIAGREGEKGARKGKRERNGN